MTFHESFVRLLAGSSPEGDDTKNSAADRGDGGGRDSYEFIAFILWYFAMILFCIVPTCCAYRRRRRLSRELLTRQRTMEIFLHQQQEAAAAEMEAGIPMTEVNPNFYIWSSPFNIYYGGNYGRNQVLTLESLNSAVAVEERKRRLEAAMKDVTFVVKKEDIINLNDNDNYEKTPTSSDSNSKKTETQVEEEKISIGEREDVTIVSDEVGGAEGDEEKSTERGLHGNNTYDLDETNAELRLPPTCLNSTAAAAGDPKIKHSDKDDDNGDTRRKTVPAMCAICLCPYEDGDQVTYSHDVSSSVSDKDIETGFAATNSHCPHAFHAECIVQWLAKKNDARPECPCCRRPFCTVVPLTTSDLVTLNSTDATTVQASVASTLSATSSGANPTNRSGRTHMQGLGAGRQLPMIALPVNNDNTNNDDRDSEQRMMVFLPNPDMVAFRDRFTG
mmetsp:Transcript_1828/g.4372  ORF Transcript_1828/g.4372 Transcript_1828/m.4372 type:complete len:446 (-) Transcript_1828:198-1535(-)